MKKNKLNLYRLWVDEKDYYPGFFDFCGKYESVIVCAKNEKEAKLITPTKEDQKLQDDGTWFYDHGWVTSPDKVHIQHIGVANENIKPGIVVASLVGESDIYPD
ncbi:MAG: hypothetical protein AABY32_01620 [Nanoarchaeota archaeon]